MAGLSIKLPACRCEDNRDRTSPASASSPAHAWRRNASRSPLGHPSTACRRLSTCLKRSESIVWFGGQFPVEPGLGGAPVAHHRDGRYLEHLGCFFHREPPKKTHFNHLRLTLVEPRQRVHGVIERHHVRGAAGVHYSRLFERNVRHPAP